MASIHKDGRDVCWRAAFTLIAGRSRRQKKRTTGTSNRGLAGRIANFYEDAAQGRVSAEEARKFFDKIADLKTRRLVMIATDEVLEEATGCGLGGSTLRGFMTSWLERTRSTINVRSFARYEQAVRRFLETMGPRAETHIGEIVIGDIERWRDDLVGRIGAETIATDLKIVRGAFQAALRAGMVSRNVAALVKRPAEDGKARRPFTPAELGRLLRVARGEMRGLLLLGIYTGGQRLRDVCLMRWQNIDMEQGTLLFLTSKTSRTMELPLPQPLRDWLANDAETSDDPAAFILPGLAGAVLRTKGETTGTVSRMFYELMVQAGLVAHRTHKRRKGGKGRSGPRERSALGFHSLRHTGTSMLKAAGVTESVTRDIVGHESAAVNRSYTDVDLESKRRALEKLPTPEALESAAAAEEATGTRGRKSDG